MTRLRTLLLTAAIAVSFSGGAARAASLSVVFDVTPQSGFPGDILTFSGTVTNLENWVVDLNSCSVNVAGDFTTDNCATFFDPVAGAPFTLAPNGTAGDTAHFSMFAITVNDPYTGLEGTPYPGTFNIIGGIEFDTGTSPDSNLVQQDFAVEAVPEPGTLALIALPLAAVFFRRRR